MKIPMSMENNSGIMIDQSKNFKRRFFDQIKRIPALPHSHFRTHKKSTVVFQIINITALCFGERSSGMRNMMFLKKEK